MDEDISELKRLIQNGFTDSEIAKRLNRHQTFIKQYIKAKDLRPRKDWSEKVKYDLLLSDLQAMLIPDNTKKLFATMLEMAFNLGQKHQIKNEEFLRTKKVTAIMRKKAEHLIY